MHGTGPVLAKKLFDVHLEFRSKMLVVTDYRGNLEDPVIPSAYHLLKPGETGTGYAQSALEKARATLLTLREHIENIRTTVTEKVTGVAGAMQKSGKKAEPKKAVAKKSVTKKTVAKPGAKKKPAAKKPTLKKAVAKSSAKKKAVVKKPALKKAVTKKTKKK